MAETAAARMARDYTAQPIARKTNGYGSQPTERTDREYVTNPGNTKNLTVRIGVDGI